MPMTSACPCQKQPAHGLCGASRSAQVMCTPHVVDIVACMQCVTHLATSRSHDCTADLTAPLTRTCSTVKGMKMCISSMSAGICRAAAQQAAPVNTRTVRQSGKASRQAGTKSAISTATQQPQQYRAASTLCAGSTHDRRPSDGAGTLVCMQHAYLGQWVKQC